MGNFNNKKRQFSATTATAPFSLILLVCMVVCIIGTTVAFFFSNDWASNKVTMSGKVDIEAVGKGDEYGSIEDTLSSSNLIVTLEDDYKHFIPGAKISVPANVKVYQSTSKPLLRAKFTLKTYRDDVILDDDTDVYNIMPQMTAELHSIITGNGWVLDTTEANEEDRYYYYIGNNDVNSTLGDTIMSEVDVTAGNAIVLFIDKDITFPTNVESDQSGYKVQFVITFEAIQNYIPDTSGAKLPNTITNSKIIFNENRDPAGGGRLTDEEIYQMYLNTLNNMPEYLSGDYVLGIMGYVDSGNTTEGGKNIWAFDGVNLDSYYTLESSYTDKNNPDDPYSSDWSYEYVQQENGEYVYYAISGGEIDEGVIDIEDISTDDINEMFNEYYSDIAEGMKQNMLFGTELAGSIAEEIAFLKSLCSSWEFSEEVINRGVYYTLTYSGGLYHLKFVADCAEYVYSYDANWVELKYTYEIVFDSNMVRKTSETFSLKGGLSPDGPFIVTSFTSIDIIIDHYTPNYKPDLSDFVPTN